MRSLSKSKFQAIVTSSGSLRFSTSILPPGFGWIRFICAPDLLTLIVAASNSVAKTGMFLIASASFGVGVRSTPSTATTGTTRLVSSRFNPSFLSTASKNEIFAIGSPASFLVAAPRGLDFRVIV